MTKKLLFVDDEQPITDLYTEVAEIAFGEDIDVVTAGTVDKAIETLTQILHSFSLSGIKLRNFLTPLQKQQKLFWLKNPCMFQK